MLSQEEKWVLQEKYNGIETPAFAEDSKRLAAGEPLAYVIGWVPFLDTTIWLDNHPLIPRTETEFWVEKAIAEIKKANNRYIDLTLNTKPPYHRSPTSVMHVLDLCAGSGAIGVAIAKSVPEAWVDFGEIDPRLLPTIQKNLELNIQNYSNRLEYYRVLASDLFEKMNTQYDFIVSNPPYIDPVLNRAEKSVKSHEPHLALYGGVSGMECIKQIVTEAPTYLTPQGQLWIEHEPEQSSEIHSLANTNGFAVSTHTDQYGVERYSVLIQYTYD